MSEFVPPPSESPVPECHQGAPVGQGTVARASSDEAMDAEVLETPAVGPDPKRQQTYVVPQRFGMSAILGIMTALAVLFGVLQSLDAHAFTYLFLGVLSLVICLVQMCFGGVPRIASVAAGTIVFAVFVLSIPLAAPRVPVGLVVFLFVLSLPFGGLLGYLTGTCAAGIFLIMDQLERFFQARRGVELATTATTSAP